MTHKTLIHELASDFSVDALEQIAATAQSRYDILLKAIHADSGWNLTANTQDAKALDCFYMLSVHAARMARLAKGDLLD